MALWAERQVKKDLGILVHRRKPQSFDKLFLTPPHVEYIAREAKTAARLRRLVGTNVVELTNFVFMDKLENHTIRAYHEDLQERMDERAHQAAELAHLQLWESVLRGQSSIPPEKLDDPCMRQVRQHQLKIEGLQQQAVRLGTTVQRVAAMPHVWFEPSRYKPRKRKGRSQSQPPNSEMSRSKQSERSRPPEGSAAQSNATSGVIVKLPDKNLVRTDSWSSRQLALKMSEDAREKRSRYIGPAPHGHQYRHLNAVVTESEVGPLGRASEKMKRIRSLEENAPPYRRDRRLSRVNPPRRPQVVFPAEPPPFVLLSCDASIGRSVMKPLGNTDFIIPRYFRPKAPNMMRDTKNLDELYAVGNSLFDSPYPAIDNHNWTSVVAERAEKKARQQAQ